MAEALIARLRREQPGAVKTLEAIVKTNGGGVRRGQIVTEQFRILRRHKLIERRSGQFGGPSETDFYIHTRKGFEMIAASQEAAR